MPNIRSTGIFADESLADGQFRGTLNGNVKVPGAVIEAIGRREGSAIFHDFIDNNDVDQYVVTNITSGTATVTAGSPNGLLRLTATTANQGLGSVQMADTTGAVGHITAAASRVIIFEARCTLGADLSVFDWYIGLGEVDTTFMLAGGALDPNGSDNHAGFHHIVANAGVPNLSSSGTAASNVQQTALGSGTNRTNRTVTASVTDATAHKFGIRIEGTNRIEFYLDDKLVHARTGTVAFDTAMTPTFTLIADGTARTMDVDYMLVTQTR